MKRIEVHVAGEGYKIRLSQYFPQLEYYEEIEVKGTVEVRKKSGRPDSVILKRWKMKVKVIILFKIQMECVICYFTDCFVF